jgi:hypothetical protein
VRNRFLIPLCALATVAAVGASGAVAGGEAIFEGPRVEQAKRVASDLADARFGLSYPPADWTALCYRKSGRKLQCPVHTDDSRCVGGMKLVRRSGEWQPRKKEMTCG